MITTRKRTTTKAVLLPVKCSLATTWSVRCDGFLVMAMLTAGASPATDGFIWVGHTASSTQSFLLNVTWPTRIDDFDPVLAFIPCVYLGFRLIITRPTIKREPRHCTLGRSHWRCSALDEQHLTKLEKRP